MLNEVNVSVTAYDSVLSNVVYTTQLDDKRLSRVVKRSDQSVSSNGRNLWIAVSHTDGASYYLIRRLNVIARIGKAEGTRYSYALPSCTHCLSGKN